MPLGEFELIQRYFSRATTLPAHIHLGIGDDAALVGVPAQQELVIAIDTLVSGVHFPSNTSPRDIAYKSLAVNLSDMAAMGASPAWFTLALTLPEASETWLAEFSTGLFELANAYQLPLIGGDTTRGPLTVTIQIAGHVPSGQALLRRGAKVGDAIYVTGTLGDAAAGLSLLPTAGQADVDTLIARLNRPTPRVSVGMALRGIASACIDISDGLLADLGHILEHSHVGAVLNVDQLPLSSALSTAIPERLQQLACALSGGDDYELCFTVAPHHIGKLAQIAKECGIALTHVGIINTEPGLRCVDGAGKAVDVSRQGFQHFR